MKRLIDLGVSSCLLNSTSKITSEYFGLFSSNKLGDMLENDEALEELSPVVLKNDLLICTASKNSRIMMTPTITARMIKSSTKLSSDILSAP